MLITTRRLTLRRFQAGDGADLFGYLHQPRASCFFSLAVPDLAAAESEALKRADDGEHIAICRSDTGRVIGDLFAVPEGDTVSVGWHLNPDHSGAGYALEAASALFDHLFASGATRRIYAYVEDSNAKSQRLCERLGMRREGLFIESCPSPKTKRAGRSSKTRCNLRYFGANGRRSNRNPLIQHDPVGGNCLPGFGGGIVREGEKPYGSDCSYFWRFSSATIWPSRGVSVALSMRSPPLRAASGPKSRNR